MSFVTRCDRCGATSEDPVSDLWVRHLVASPWTAAQDIDSDGVARDNDLCHACREAYEDWFRRAAQVPA